MKEPPEPNSPEAMRICRAFRDGMCITLPDGRPSFWCHPQSRRRWNDIPSIERWDGREEDV